MPTSRRAVDAEGCPVRTGSTSAERVAVDRRRDSAKARDEVVPFYSQVKRSRSSPHHARARNPKPLVLAAFFGYFLSLVTESTPPEAFIGTRGTLEGITQPRLFRGLGDGSYGLPRALRALAMTHCMNAVRVRAGDRKGRPYGGVLYKRCGERAAV